jgi:NAD(P)-dependent dehydrogenase (short-subunit alcohol dehydrogenase family)
MGKTIVITGGTGGIGYQAGLALAKADPQNVIVITGRSAESGKAAVETMKKDSGNPNIHLALADLSMQSAVRSLAQDLMARFPAIDVLVNNAGNLSPSDRGLEMVKEGGQTIVKNFSVNVMAPLLLSRLLVPALKKATPVGNVQITSGGMLVDGFSLDDIEAKKVQVGIPAYSQSKRVMEAMSLALSKEFEPHGIPVNIIGGGNPGATAMTSVVGSKDLPPWMRCCYPCFSCFMHRWIPASHHIPYALHPCELPSALLHVPTLALLDKL